MRKFFLTFLFSLTLLLTVFAQHRTFAWMYSYTAETADKKYLFVMRDVGRSEYFISDKYEKSGMYLNDGSTTPLWTVDWKESIYLPNDGKHIIRIGRLKYSATYREEAFTFFSEGNALKTYETKDLIAFPWLLPHSSNGYEGLNCSSLGLSLPNDGALMKVDNGEGYSLNNGAVFDNEKQTMQIGTSHGDKYLFDFKTGNIISSERPSRNLAFALFCALIIGYAIYLFFAARAKLGESFLNISICVAGILVTVFLFLIPIISILPYKHSCSTYEPDYPDFWTCCYLSVSMLPRYLLTSLNIISQPLQDMPSSSYETTISWLLLFWLPCTWVFAILTKYSISFLKSKQRNLR
jgi:hypothetical protein